LPPNTTTTTTTTTSINTTPSNDLNNDKLFSSLVLSINNLNQSIQVESLINSTTATNTECNNLRQLVKHGHVQLLNVIIINQSLLCNNLKIICLKNIQ
jgi:hypothetical protein